MLQEALSKEGYSCEQAFSGTEAKLLLNMQDHDYALVLLDLMLPGNPGEAVLEEIRKKGNLPVIVLTAKDSLDEKVEVLTSGADDYITKPFRILELRARVAAHLRREKREHHSTLSFEPDIRFELYAKVLYDSEQPVPLTKSEYSICEYLAKNRDRFLQKNKSMKPFSWLME